MKRTTIKVFKKNKYLEVIKNNNTLILMFLFIVIGFFIGCLAVKFNLFNLRDKNCSYFLNYLNLRKNQTFFKILINTFLNSVTYFILIFFSGTCLAGPCLIPLIAGFCGFYSAVVISHLYIYNGLLGILFSILIVIPPSLTAFFAVMLEGREALGFSVCFLKLVMPGTNNKVFENLNRDFKYYCTRQLFIVLMFLVSALLDSLLSVSFIRLFNL